MDTKETKLTATQLARSLSDVLNRVQYKGERFVIERNGQVVATLQPTAVTRKGPTLEEFVEALKHAPRPDDEFEDDLRAIQAAQRPFEIREWPE
jgi:antitoxin (DNA-binding transcriptional repressor) of toxin-antitoxin stability system